MPDELRRRSFLAAAGAGTGFLAGCHQLAGRRPATERDALRTDDKRSTPDEGPPDDADDGDDLPDPSNPLGGIEGYRVASTYVGGGSGTPDDPWRLSPHCVAEPGLVAFDAGTFAAEGLVTGEEIDYERWSVHLRGAGVRTTALRKLPADGHLLAFADARGNFGGVRDMALYGNYPNEGKRSRGNLLHSWGGPIDLLFENLIVRWGWGDAIHVGASSSGVRVRNIWAENSAGWGIFLGGGTRAKLSNLHVISCSDGAVHVGNSRAQISNVSIFNALPGLRMDCFETEVANVKISGDSAGGTAVEETDDADANLYTNVLVDEATVGATLRGAGSQLTNSTVRNTRGQAVRLSGDRTAVDGIAVSNFGRSGAPAFELAGTGCRVAGVSVGQQSSGYGGRVLARVTGDRAVLANVTIPPGLSVEIDGATEAVLHGITLHRPDAVRDGGTRTLVNGAGTNAGDPRRTGEWEGHAEYAAATGATVWDTTTTPWTPYRADGAGNWLSP